MKVQVEGFMAVRFARVQAIGEEHSEEWFDGRTLSKTKEASAILAKQLDFAYGHVWSRDNPVVRIARVKVTEE